MRWFTALQRVARNGAGSRSFALGRWFAPDDDGADALGMVPIEGHGQLSGADLAAAGASLAVRSGLPTIADMHDERERLEVFVERAATDVATRHLRGNYWDLQSAEVDADDEMTALAAEMERVGQVEGAAVVGWVIRNAAIRARRPIASLARAAEDVNDVSVDALGMAETLLDSAQRLDPTYGGYVFSLRPERRDGLRLRDRFGHLWVYGD